MTQRLLPEAMHASPSPAFRPTKSNLSTNSHNNLSTWEFHHTMLCETSLNKSYSLCLEVICEVIS